MSDAVAAGIPVLDGTWDGDRVRVFCNACFAFHFHGSGGLKVPHCLFAARWYFIRLVDDLPDAYAYRTPAGSWRVRCLKGHWHRSRILGPVTHPHKLRIAAAPPPGAPIYCTESGRFFDLVSGEQVDAPDYGPQEAARFGYLDRDPCLAGQVADR